MNTSRLLSPLLAGLALCCAAMGAHADPAATITGVGTRDVSGALQMNPSSVNLGNNRALLITGYLADLSTRDVGRNGRVILEAGDGTQWAIPFVNRLWGAKVAVESATDALLDEALASSIDDAGFLAAADAYTLPPGNYTVKSVVAIFGAASTMTVPVAGSMSVVIPQGRITSALMLTDPQSAPVVFTPKVNTVSGDIRLSEYPIQRSGIYKLATPAYDKWGQTPGIPTEFTLNYRRPVVRLEASNPRANGFEGFPKVFSLVNPLTQEKLTGPVQGEATIEQGPTAPATASVNGVAISGSAPSSVTLEDAIGPDGATKVYSARASSGGAGGEVNVFLNLPDAPDIEFGIANWDPNQAIAVVPAKTSFAVGVEPAAVNAVRVSGSPCGVVYDANATGIKFGASTVYCALRWITKPAGLNPVAPYATMQGRLTTQGTFPAEFETGVLWTHPTTKQVVFSSSAQRSVDVVATAPTPPTVRFLSDPSLIRTGATNLLTYAGTAIPGGLQVSSPYAGMGVNLAIDAGSVVPATTTSNRFYRPILLENSVVGTPRTLNVEMYYAAAPDTKYNQTLTFDVLPRKQTLNLVPPPLATSTAPLNISAFFGAYNGDGTFQYDPVTQGRWSLQLATVAGDGSLTPVGDPVTNIGPDGSFTFQAGLLTPGLRTFTALATQTDAPDGTNITVRGRNLAIFIRNGLPIPLLTITKPTVPNGPSPFTAQIGVWPTTRDRLFDVGEVRYEESEDGSNWVPMLKTDGTPMTGQRMLFTSQTLTGNDSKYVRTIVKNRWSGAESMGEVSELQSFIVPTIGIKSPRYTFVEHPITVTSVVTDADPATLLYKWTVKYGRYDPMPTIVQGGTSLTFNPTISVPDLIIELEAKDQTAPDNPRATRRAAVAVAVLPPVLARPSVTGPTVVESGQTYTWSAFQRSPFPAGTETDLVIKSHWVLPDGTNSTTNPISYTMKEGDQGRIRYESWIEGYPNSLIGFDLLLKPWVYEWPAMKMAVGVINPYAPARVQFSAGLANPALLTSLHGEPLTFNFSLPQGAIVVSQKDGVLVADFPTAGTYVAGVTISDTRGNSSTVESPAFVVQPPKPLTFNFTLTSADRWNRPPGPALARTAVTSVPVGDVVRGVTFFVNGTQAGPEVLSGANFSLPDPGTYEVRALMTTVKGNTAEATQNITLTTGDNPVCNLTKNGDGVTTLWFAANCSVQRGVITKYRWKVNGQETTVTATTFKQLAAYIPSTATVEVTATTDFGQWGGAIYNMSTGQVTRTP
jgi:hypothetical protein